LLAALADWDPVIFQPEMLETSYGTDRQFLTIPDRLPRRKAGNEAKIDF